MKRVLFLLMLALPFCTSLLQAQEDTLVYSARTPEWVGQFTTLSANAVLGGITAGVIQELRGGSFKDGFARGALGGSIIYTGKRIAAERFDGAGLIGRQVGAVGTSVVRNASDGVGSFDRLILPTGIGRVYWQRKQGRLAFKVDAFAASYVIYGIFEDELDFDTRESLSAGAVVFRTHNKLITTGGGEHSAGVSRAGVILRADIPAYGDEFLARALAHERVHVLQDDQLFVTLNDHVDDWALSKLGRVSTLSKYVDVNVSTEALRLLARLIPNHPDRPWEMESIYLTRK